MADLYDTVQENKRALGKLAHDPSSEDQTGCTKCMIVEIGVLLAIVALLVMCAVRMT